MYRPHLDQTRPATPARRLGDLDVERDDTASRRRRRRTLQRSSVVVAALFMGATQCDPAPAAEQPSVAAALSAPATTTAANSPTSSPTIATTPAASAGHTATPAASATPSTSPTTAAPTTTAPEPVRIPGPDGTTAEGRCTQYEDLLMIHAPEVGWDALRMSRLAWRESNCWADIRSRTSDTGLLQINDITLSFLNEALGEPVDRWTLTDPVQNIRAAAALCTFWVRNGSSCYQPWNAN